MEGAMQLTFVIDGMERKLVSLSNAAGMCKRLDEFEDLAVSAAEEPMLGSITPLYRPGHTGGTTFYYDEAAHDAVNALGLPNLGWERYRELIGTMVEMAKRLGKRMRISVAGFSPRDYFVLVKRLVELLESVDALAWVIIEVNFGCPNTADDSGKRHKIISYDPETLLLITRGLYGIAKGRVTLAFKLSPYDAQDMIERRIREEVCAGFEKQLAIYQGPVELVLCNTIGGQRVYRPDGSPALGVMDNVGGKSGRCLKPRSIENIHYFSSGLGPRVIYVGAGGVENAQDVIDYLRAGATKVQVGAWCAQHGNKVFGETYQELGTKRPEFAEAI